MDLSDKELLSRYHGGDVAALEVLVKRYRRPLFSYIMQIVGNQKDAEDVFQEVWYRAIRKLDRYRQDSLLGWLIRIARNHVIDQSRRHKADLILDRETETGETMVNSIKSGDPEPSAHVADAETGARLRLAVAQLPDDQREVFLLRSQSDLPFKEIARIQKVSINTALARMQYALQKLRVSLKTDYAEVA